ncbi:MULTISPECIES: 30S ribosomal protein THX [Edaphocola]|jgi:ribosomal small subunit protein bTHX|nr:MULTISPECIES: 30S ribosomal protein THX [Edaphocola]
MGRGDNRSKRGKISNGTFGVNRPKKARNAKAKAKA